MNIFGSSLSLSLYSAIGATLETPSTLSSVLFCLFHLVGSLVCLWSLGIYRPIVQANVVHQIPVLPPARVFSSTTYVLQALKIYLSPPISREQKEWMAGGPLQVPVPSQGDLPSGDQPSRLRSHTVVSVSLALFP